ncbi:50S ribosomal protein L10 [Deltaproteobacteria bacterium TL4]
MDKTAKEALIGELKELFTSASAAILVDYRGLTANDIVELRKKLSESSSKMKVIKNTLAKIASKGTPFEGLNDQLVNTRAIVASQDPVGQAKVLTDFAKKKTSLVIQGGILSTQGRTSLLTESEVQALAKLPSRDELLVKFLFLLQAPAAQFVRTLSEVPAKFLRVLSAIAESKN